MITLRAFPVALFAAASAQWSDMLRDYVLRGIGGADQPYGVDDIARSVHALDVVRATVLGASTRGTTADRIDLDLTPGEVTAGDFAVLQGALDHARKLAIAGLTLALPSLPEVVALRDWMCEEVMGQSAGAPPSPWEFTAVVDAPLEGDLAAWDHSIAPPQDESWLVGDDRNRIIAASSAALALLGWAESDLVGQRLLAVIPEHLREQHVVGFTRSAVSGDYRLLGQPLPLPALARDGREIPITLTLTRHLAARGRAVFLARLDPVG